MTSLYLPAPKRSHNTKSFTGSNNISSDDKSKNDNSMHGVNNGDVTTTSTSINNNTSNLVSKGRKLNRAAVPTYEERCKAALEASKQNVGSNRRMPLFVPRSIADFEDGGAFPEIHVAQYPRHMGNPNKHRRQRPSQNNGNNGNSSTHNSSSTVGNTSTALTVLHATVDSKGRKDYTALVTSGTNSDKKVYATHKSLRPTVLSVEEKALPSKEEILSTTERTAAALQSLISSKMAMSKPSGSALINAATAKDREAKTEFVKYTPSKDVPGYNPAAAQRIVRMVPAQVDPMMPPKHKHTKAPRGPAEDPVPVLHAPPEKLTKEERDSWNVPACISNWKNTRGYTIPLDKRLAADGRGLRDESTVNGNFATLSESLYLAERQAREEVRMRALVQKRKVESDRDRRERELRELAAKARMERGGGGVAAAVTAPHNYEQQDHNTQNDDHDDTADDANEDSNAPHVVPNDDMVAAQQRERLRASRRKEMEREFRMDHMGAKRKDDEDNDQNDVQDNVVIKKARLESDRDVSEKIALGVHTGTGASDGGVDGRLYNQNAGLDSGFGPDDEYNTYTKKMFDREGVSSSSIYRPTRGEAAMDADEQYSKLMQGATNKFQPDKGFAGAEGGVGASSSGAARNAPVQFEKGGQK